MKNALKSLGWIDYRGKTDWREIKIDVLTTALVISIVLMWTL